jgi:hypothetical protein
VTDALTAYLAEVRSRLKAAGSTEDYYAVARTDVDILLQIVEEQAKALDWYAKWDWTDKYVQAVPKRANEAQARITKLIEERGK